MGKCRWNCLEGLGTFSVEIKGSDYVVISFYVFSNMSFRFVKINNINCIFDLNSI